MEQEILPIGSVITLKDNNQKILITGLYSVAYEKNIVVYDYQGCSYPEGITLSDKIYSFNNDDIDRILFKGYEDESFIDLRNKLIDGPYEETEDDYIMDYIMDEVEPNEEIQDLEEMMDASHELLEELESDDELEILAFE